MEKKEQVQIVYRRFREDVNKDTAMCLEFLKWLHKEKNELIYLKDMTGITSFEVGYIEQLLNEGI